MNSFLLIVIAVAALVAAALLWKKREDIDFADASLEHEPEDTRVTPLLRGINYLLSDKPDQALQEMVQVAKIRSESAEVYMALGEMFRTQGEYGRAVRIHQNLLARPEVSLEFQFQAYVSLGRDFQAGGLLDRALKHYAKALAIQPDHIESLHACLRIREQSNEWDEAEWLVSRLEQVENQSAHEHRAYLKAEMAKDAFDKQDITLAEALLDEALKLSAACSHAHLLRVELFIMEENFDKAVEQTNHFLTDVKEEHHVLLPKILLQHMKFYEQYAKSFLLAYWQNNKNIELGVTWVEKTAKLVGLAQAADLQKTLDLKNLSLRHELRLMALQGGSDNLHKQAKEWRLLSKMFACKQCGVQVHDMRWHCPKCHHWGTMEPLKGAYTFGEEQHAQ